MWHLKNFKTTLMKYILFCRLLRFCMRVGCSDEFFRYHLIVNQSSQSEKPEKENQLLTSSRKKNIRDLP